ncbi:class I SAM-dependent methyltransferase [Mycolicibacterium sp. F2034L]|uniref:class I SAM-dependent methyltransferase n=1 Tax=Mycolicibacterium sp. F2034L TaxID=2926422 RepID=UPI001FF13250|nr:methyltransferase domain-containing protein [Mycolicibacterium sp. F2034L]MCK0177428.1 class I SAM-dependent methyltransferase [Mycolicibacterium sp. F2034L]
MSEATEATEAEFDTVAEWTARVAVDLGERFYLPAACRGSGSPPGLDWLIGEMRLSAGAVLLDCGAGVGGPAAYAAQSVSADPLLVEPEAGACRAARRLFGLPVLQGIGSALPVADESVDAAWALGVLCTTRDQLTLLTEMRRTVRPRGPIGLLVFMARDEDAADHLESNHFPTRTELTALIEQAGLRVDAWRSTTDLPPIPQEWDERTGRVTEELTSRYAHTRAWQLAERQSSAIGDLLGREAVTGEMLVLTRA